MGILKPRWAFVESKNNSAVKKTEDEQKTASVCLLGFENVFFDQVFLLKVFCWCLALIQ